MKSLLRPVENSLFCNFEKFLVLSPPQFERFCHLYHLRGFLPLQIFGYFSGHSNKWFLVLFRKIESLHAVHRRITALTARRIRLILPRRHQAVLRIMAIRALKHIAVKHNRRNFFHHLSVRNFCNFFHHDFLPFWIVVSRFLFWNKRPLSSSPFLSNFSLSF